ncbi:VIT1/CCC1 transporter family protein [Ligilactobacillus equi]|uniref:Integral membrane protein n=1 Tax=Ligilactobacillus equi DPC 6820 TaxID=1392007 RepID=V7HY53_9LACO|nr:VIT family protein [Ligilactobacillus equi]ETA74225.1 integral membrane protein [Ligilactobacillus equi DPC 6820]MCQ2557253.1 VIT family protein [Ligilactobacillus sp.]
MFKKNLILKKHPKKTKSMEERMNTLRAGVLGANDGILTVVGVLFSVAVATPNRFTIFIAGLADLIACAFSMASGEYASVSTQSDTEKEAVALEQRKLDTNPEEELAAVSVYYQEQGISPDTADEIARDLLSKKPLETVVAVKYDLTLGEYMNPWDAAFSSLISASLGGILPLLAMSLFPAHLMWQATIVAVCISVSITGFLSAKLGNGLVKIAVFRNLIVGILTMIIHYSLGLLL